MVSPFDNNSYWNKWYKSNPRRKSIFKGIGKYRIGLGSMNKTITGLKLGLPKEIWTQDIDIIAPHLKEWRDIYNGNTPIMLTPRTTAEVSKCINALSSK